MTCTVDGCDRKPRSHGLCDTHRKQAARKITEGKPVCKVEDCDKVAEARGWCMKHWQRWRTHGDPLHIPYSKTKAGKERAEAPALVTVELACCGDCGQRLGTIPIGGSPWAAIDRHHCNRRTA